MFYDQIMAEEFTQLISKSAGVDDIQMEIDERFMNRKISFRGSSLLTIINSIAVTDLLGIVPYELYNSYRDFLNLKEIKLEDPFSCAVQPCCLYFLPEGFNNRGDSREKKRGDKSLNK